MEEIPQTPQDGIIPEPETVVETPVTVGAEPTPEVPEVKTYTEEQWNELHGRATKAEAELKTLRPKAKASPVTQTSSSVEETVLLAQGMDESLLNELKAVAQARKIPSLIKAQNDPIFIAVKEKFEKDQKQKDASLPASRGSGGVKVTKNFSTPNLTEEEHKKMVKDLNL